MQVCLEYTILHSLTVVPSSGPTNVSAFATTSSSILVRWGEVPEADRNGLILGYKVRSCHQNALYFRIARLFKGYQSVSL